MRIQPLLIGLALALPFPASAVNKTCQQLLATFGIIDQSFEQRAVIWTFTDAPTLYEEVMPILLPIGFSVVSRAAHNPLASLRESLDSADAIDLKLISDIINGKTGEITPIHRLEAAIVIASERILGDASAKVKFEGFILKRSSTNQLRIYFYDDSISRIGRETEVDGLLRGLIRDGFELSAVFTARASGGDGRLRAMHLPDASERKFLKKLRTHFGLKEVWVIGEFDTLTLKSKDLEQIL